ncbi:MAG: glycosyltransferase family 2 protein, partial [Planctomycetia bacterium]
MPCAPIALFTYNRLEHTAATLAALARNPLADESPLWAFSDGPRTGRTEDREKIAAVRDLLRSVRGFREVHVVERPENLGLSRSIIAGVGEMVERHGRVIVLEDDIVTSPHFLRYMNDGLDCYEHDDRVISIHGYVYPITSA